MWCNLYQHYIPHAQVTSYDRLFWLVKKDGLGFWKQPLVSQFKEMLLVALTTQVPFFLVHWHDSWNACELIQRLRSSCLGKSNIDLVLMRSHREWMALVVLLNHSSNNQFKTTEISSSDKIPYKVRHITEMWHLQLSVTKVIYHKTITKATLPRARHKNQRPNKDAFTHQQAKHSKLYHHLTFVIIQALYLLWSWEERAALFTRTCEVNLSTVSPALPVFFLSF